MKKHLLALSAAAVLLAPNAVGAEGFSINEWSAEGFGMGGARMFAENDAANMAYNPASLTKIQGEKAKISATYISPHGKYKTYKNDEVNDQGGNRIHPAWAPGMYYAKQLNDKSSSVLVLIVVLVTLANFNLVLCRALIILALKLMV